MSALEWNLGPILLGTMFNIFLYGILITQVAVYCVSLRKDRTWLKILVAWLTLLETLNTIFEIGFIYRYTIILFGDFEAVGHSHWLLDIEPTTTVMISSSTQGFFAWRIVRLTGRVWVGWAIAAAAFLQFLAGVASSIAAWIVADFSRFQSIKVPVILWLSTSAAIDVALTCILTWHLHRNRTGVSRTDDIITRIIRLTVPTGMVTSVWAVTDLTLYLVVPNNLHIVLTLTLCKLYSNSLMSTLNARGLQDSNGDIITGGISMSGAFANTVIRTSSHLPTIEQPKVYQASQRASKTDDSFELDDYTKASSTRAQDAEANLGMTLSSGAITFGIKSGKRSDSLHLPLPAKTGPQTIASDEWSVHSQPSGYDHKQSGGI